jgi:arylformamidase
MQENFGTNSKMQPGPKIYDISPLISNRIAVFPGDQKFERKVFMDFPKGDHLALSSILTTVHLGAHTDAPNHYHCEGQSIDQRDLHYYLGPCQVISVQLPRGERITQQHMAKSLKGNPIQAPRVLFKTGSFPNSDQWNGDFNSFSPELIDELARQKVVLIGIDTPSVDPADSKALESHQAVFRNNLAILEGIVLDEVPDGLYTLIALPLKIEGADASPVRAILVSDLQNRMEKK